MTARNFSTIAAASKAVNFVLAETSYWGRGQHARAWSRAQPSELQATPTPAAPPGAARSPKTCALPTRSRCSTVAVRSNIPRQCMTTTPCPAGSRPLSGTRSDEARQLHQQAPWSSNGGSGERDQRLDTDYDTPTRSCSASMPMKCMAHTPTPPRASPSVAE